MIELRRVSVNNLKDIDLDLPYGKMIVLCGRSGSGKSSLAMDTLYAEGQRRYIESFSAYTRQFLEKLEKPDAERIDGIPAAIAVTSKSLRQMSRSTVGTVTETTDYLRLLFSKIGTVFCPCCGKEIKSDTPQSILSDLKKRFVGNDDNGSLRIQVAFAPKLDSDREDFQRNWKEQGIVRGLLYDRPFRLDEEDVPEELYEKARTTDNHDFTRTEQTTFFNEDDDDFDIEDESDAQISINEPTSKKFFEEVKNDSDDEQTDVDPEAETKSFSSFFLAESISDCKKTAEPEKTAIRSKPPILLIVDRLTLGTSEDFRIIESLETALALGDGVCHILVQNKNSDDGRKSQFERLSFSRRFSCEDCNFDFPALEPKLFSFNSPLGACPVCEGFGNLMMYDLDLIVPNKSKTISGGAIAPWSTPAYKPKLDEFLNKADSWDIPVDVPFEKLDAEQLDRFLYGAKKESDKEKTKYFEGLFGFFQRLERQKYKMHVRVFLSRWRNYRPCPECHGTRLRPEALSVRIFGKNIAEQSDMKIEEFRNFLNDIKLDSWQQDRAKTTLEQIRNRLDFMIEVGLGYLSLSRTMRTLSSGEQRRISLTSALGSSLVDMLYVLDEPSIGLHPGDTDHLLASICKLRDRGNTVVVVEHEEVFLRTADQIVEIGPGAGEAGGTVVFQGTTQEMINDSQSLTGTYLSGKRSGNFSNNRRLPENGVIELVGCRGNNLHNITAAFPMGMLCVVTGVSGAGKSSLVQETLYPALCRHFGKENIPQGLPFDQLIVGEELEDVILVDQNPIGRSPRSNPATYLKIFDEIRSVFASTPDAKARHFTAGKFSFNVEGGRCEHCKGDGFTIVDMQFMADMYVRCPQCKGKRYRAETLDILYRGKNIADVLDMTVREAFGFFRGQAKVQHKLKRLIDVGLDYIRLGQPANTLSGGESQRLKLAAYLSHVKKSRSLFLLDEPTTGLHFADVVQLLDCFDALIQTGHSLVVVEHNLQVIRAADHLIDLGPGAADLGGRIIAQGTPEEVASVEESLTGKFLQT